MLKKFILEIQSLYPQIYLACHIDHVRASSTNWQLSSRDASILAHLNPAQGKGISPRVLAAHLGVAPSTLSAALERLSRLGYIESIPCANDRRKHELLLTEQGAEAMTATSVLDAERIGLMLEKLSIGEREKAVEGLALLARAARKMKEEEKK